MEQQRANRARYMPKFSVGGNYGALGRSIGDLRGTGLLQGTLSITLFDRDRTGEAEELAARMKRVDDQRADLKLGIEEEIREATLNLDSAREQVTVAHEGRDLAQQELDLSQERFRAGVTNNIEVTNAQDALARAQENYILAVARHADARFALARAAGATEQNIERYLASQ
jgi:outer membrane protein TolC